jgi:hypothetical protein
VSELVRNYSVPVYGLIWRNVALVTLMMLPAILLTREAGAGADSKLSPAQQAYLKQLDGPTLLRGDYLRAILVAYDDFSHELDKNAADSKAPGTQNKKLAEWLSRIEHFDIRVSRTDEGFVVEFGPTVRNDAMTVFGGGGRYVINEKSFAISSKILSK